MYTNRGRSFVFCTNASQMTDPDASILFRPERVEISPGTTITGFYTNVSFWLHVTD